MTWPTIRTSGRTLRGVAAMCWRLSARNSMPGGASGSRMPGRGGHMSSNQALPTRRGVLIGAAAVVASRSLYANYGDKDKNPRYTAAIIGHTGRGNYGHDVDLV